MARSPYEFKRIIDRLRSKKSRAIYPVIGAGLFLLLFVVVTWNDGLPDYLQEDANASGDNPIPIYEIYPEEPIPPRKPLPEPPSHKPRIAIIIDDIGYDRVIAKKILDLGKPITLSIFPYSPHGQDIAAEAASRGIEIMMHLPMEPVEYPSINPGPGVLLTSMSRGRFIHQLNKNISMLSTIKGVNNHMGSRLTASSTHVYQVLSVLKKNNLFFIDSLTTGRSRCDTIARILQIPFATRDVFLDHVLDENVIRGQFIRLLHIANSYGEAVGIGHPHQVTYRILREMLPIFEDRVDLVPASDIVHTIG